MVFVSNFLIAGNVELAFDEAYYWIYSEHLAWGYFDHPPMVALFIKAGTFLFGNTEFAVRFAFNIAMCTSCALVYNLVGRKNPFVVALMLMSMPLIMFAGIFALPDTPLLLFSLLFLVSLKRYLVKDNIFNCLLVSLSIAGMFYSKYHGLLIVLLTVIACPSFLKKKSFWLCIAFVITLFLPHMYWQYQHDFISFKFHLTGRAEKHFEINNIISYITGQIALMGVTLVPLFFIKLKKLNRYDPFERILIFNSLGFFIFLFFLSFRNQIEANWTVSCAAVLIILFAKHMRSKRLVVMATIIPITIIILAKSGLLMSETLVKKFKLTDNRLNEITYWKDIRIPLIKKLCGELPIVADSYQVASKLSFYLDQKIPALHISSRSSQFELLDIKESIKTGKFCFLTSNPRLPSVRIETNFKDPIYVVQEISLSQLNSI